MKTIRASITFAALSAMLCSWAVAAQQPAGTVSEQDKTFVENAAQGGLAEVQFGGLGSQKGQVASVRTFGDRMVKDHTAANEKLAAICKTLGLTVPTAVNNKQQATYQKLESLTGAAFDKSFSRTMVHDHHAAIALFEKEIKSGSSPALKQFAEDTLPTLKEHLAMTKDLPK